MENTEQIKKLIDLSGKLIFSLEKESFWQQAQSGDTLEGLQSTHQKLKTKNYTVAVIAAMKAGKSTLFNGLLGRDILPNETAACTASITEIRFSKKQFDRVIKHLKDGTTTTITAGNGKTVEENFHRDVRNSREQNGISTIEKYYMEYPIQALNNEQYGDLVENFLLVDTPGPNEASTGQFDTEALKATTYYQLRNADAIIFVFDYGVYKSDTNANLIKEIFAGREDVKKDNDKIFFVVNKIDTRTSKDGTKEEVVRSVQDMIRYQTENTLDKPQVLPVSALMALYGRGIEGNTITDEALRDCKNKYQALFSKEIVIEGETYLKQLKPEEFASQLIEQSGIIELERNVILNTFKKASSKLIEGAIENIGLKSEFMIKTLEAHIQIQNKGIEELKSGIERSKKEINDLHQLSNTIGNDAEKQLQHIHMVLSGMVSNMAVEITSTVDKQLQAYQNVYQSTDRSYLSNIAAQVEKDCGNAITTYSLRKQDEVIRKYNELRFELMKSIYQGFKLLSERANAIVKKHLDIEIESEGLLSMEIGELNVQGSGIKSSGGSSAGLSDRDFQNQAARGASAASTGAMIGLRVGGPVGAVVGAIAGFFWGVGTYENKFPDPVEATTYTLDITQVKEDIRQRASVQAGNMQQEFTKQSIEEHEQIRKAITSNINSFIESLNEYLDNLESDYEIKRSERENYIRYLEGLEKCTIGVREQVQEIKLELLLQS